MKTFFFSFLLLFSNTLIAQKHDNIWLFGYGSATNEPMFGGSVLDFSEDTPAIFEEYRDMNLRGTNGSICDKAGNLLFYTNGIYIANSDHEPMENGTGINPVGLTGDYEMFGLIIPQGAIAIPRPGSTMDYYLIHEPLDHNQQIGWHTPKVFYSLISFSENPLGKVVEKNEVLIDQPVTMGNLTMTRHANGRDWWLIVPQFNSDIYHRFFINPEGIEYVGEQAIGDMVISGLGQAVFSPDGSRYVRYNGIDQNIGDFVDIYDFDRCTGLLDNHLQMNFLDQSFSGGAAISPNSRYLYTPSYNFVYQFDLWADDIPASKDTVAIYDGFVVEVSPTFFIEPRFFMGQLAPDGKIYINSPGAPNTLHVIHNPNEAGAACNLEQHAIFLPTWNNSSLPNFPNYRLGALEGSPCDTLLVTSVESLASTKAEVVVYPNPAIDYLEVEVTTTEPYRGSIELYDALGKRLFRRALSVPTVERIALPDLPAGLYYYQVTIEEGGVRSGKVVIGE